MSSNFWQTNRQSDLYSSGHTATQRVKDYVQIWTSRCYSDIPDELPALLAKSNRAPCWKSVAVALLKNDVRLESVGFSRAESDLTNFLMNDRKERESNQARLF